MMNIEEVSHDGQALALTAQIASAYLSSNAVPVKDVASVLETIYSAVSALGKAGPAVVEVEPPTPAVPIRKSVTADYIICLEDGKKLKMLKRHLRTAYGMTPEEYRARWGLLKDYPMVAPNYARTRSTLAKAIGLGRGRAGPRRAA